MTQSPTARPPQTPSTPRRVKGPIRRSPLSLLLFLAAGIACVVAVAVAAAVLYIGQSAYQAGHQKSPTEAVDAMLDAALNNHDASATDKYLCSGGVKVKRTVHQLVRQINDFNQSNPGTFLTYEWSLSKTSQRDDHAIVMAHVRAKTTSSGSSLSNPEQTWTFKMRDQGGWKVCGLTIPQN